MSSLRQRFDAMERLHKLPTATVIVEDGNALCATCRAPMVRQRMGGQTLVGYGRGPCGAMHDDNCCHDTYTCGSHVAVVYLRRSCPCGWKGKRTCGCHVGEKVEQWP